MRAAVRWGTAGSLVLSALWAAPTGAAGLSTAVAPADLRPVAPLSAPPTSGSTNAREAAGAQEAAGVRAAVARAAVRGISFGPCAEEENLPAPVECGTVEVPLDYAHPDDRRIALTVSRVPATGTDPDGHPTPRQGALVFNPGGPGGNGTYFPLIGGVPAWQRIAAAYDLVGYAPRGVGRSAPLSCQAPGDFVKAPTQAPVHPSASYKKERVAEATSYARGCARRAGDALQHYTTLNNARDLDVLRAALDERQLTFMGASYGTYLGAVYATLFPAHVRRMVFDSVVDPRPDRIWYRNDLDRTAAFEQRWADFRSWVARHDDVYGLGRTAAAVQRSYEEVRAAVAAEPAGGKVGPGQLHAAYLRTAHYDDYWPMRAAALSAFQDGDPELLVAQAAPIPEVAAETENAHAVYTAVRCNDAPWPTDFADWDAEHTALAATAPFAAWDNAWTHLPCAYWRAPRQQPLDVRADAAGLPPTLILAAERDAVTPYRGAQELRERLGGARLVTERDAGQHGVGGGSNACVNAHLDAYLLTGRLPEADTECAGHAQPRPLATRGTERGPDPAYRVGPR
ncbi:alpha/beta hydrolase [Streptomyces sp. NPDC059816]|uniref:alpha/beta hydrolase n=1 Tax=Streptomyces sp. NPDC059816 TaxID=3346960 RepID=UPI003667819B